MDGVVVQATERAVIATKIDRLTSSPIVFIIRYLVNVGDLVFKALRVDAIYHVQDRLCQITRPPLKPVMLAPCRAAAAISRPGRPRSLSRAIARRDATQQDRVLI
jgi:hypothetical protein